MLLLVHVLGIPRSRRAVHTPTLVSKPAWVTSLRPALIGLGLRGRALERIELQPLPPDQPVDAVSAFTTTLTQLEARGVGPVAVAGMLSRQPRLLPSLLTSEPAETLSAMAELGLRSPLSLLEQQPLLLSLGAAHVQTAAIYLEGYVGRERLAEFVRLHPQSLLWRPDEASPAAQHLSMLGLPDALIKRVGRSFPALYRLASAANLEAIVLYLQQEQPQPQRAPTGPNSSPSPNRNPSEPQLSPN